jgi:hypothetical protein
MPSRKDKAAYEATSGWLGIRPTRHPYTEAMVERRGAEALEPLLASAVVFDSAALYRPFVGKDAVLRLLPVLRDCFADVEVTDEFSAERRMAFIFTARLATREVQGLQLVRYDAQGLIERITGMVRPFSGLAALVEAMAPHVVTLPDGTHDIR